MRVGTIKRFRNFAILNSSSIIDIMFFRQIYERGLAHASYMVGCQATGTVSVIDPKRDIDTYLEIAEVEKLKITHILETHIHADFLCGSRELQSVTGADIYSSDEGGEEWQYAFPRVGLREGDSFLVGNIRFDVWHTPGHTPEHICFLVTDTPASEKPIMFFSGDFVFVNDVGRPDLLERAAGYKGTMEAGARQMFNSLQRFKTLPDYIQLHPAHGAGSACGKSLGAVPSSTVGYERIVNWALQIENEEEFVDAILSDQPEPPKYFAMMKMLNKEVRELQTSVPTYPAIEESVVLEFSKEKKQILDTRHKSMFAEKHIKNSFHVMNNNALSTRAGWIMDYSSPIIVICAKAECSEVARRLMRIGLDNVLGYFDAEMVSVISKEFTSSLPTTTAEQFYSLSTINDFFLLDVRNKKEFDSSHINRSEQIHFGYLRENLERIPKSKEIALICQSGDRSSIAGSILLRSGFNQVLNVDGGVTAWMNKNYPLTNQ